jgi:hypothetical protein
MAAKELGVLPVLDRGDPRRLDGLITQFDLLRARRKLLLEERHAERVLSLPRIRAWNALRGARRSGIGTPGAPAATAPSSAPPPPSAERLTIHTDPPADPRPAACGRGRRSAEIGVDMLTGTGGQAHPGRLGTEMKGETGICEEMVDNATTVPYNPEQKASD